MNNLKKFATEADYSLAIVYQGKETFLPLKRHDTNDYKEDCCLLQIFAAQFYRFSIYHPDR